MADVELVKPGAIVRWDATSVVPSPRWAVRLASRRMVVGAGLRALTTKPLLPASAVVVAAWAAAKVAAAAAGRGGAARGTGGAEEVGRILDPAAPGATLEVSWTHVEMRWRR